MQGQVVEKRKKLVQFQVLFWLLSYGRPMTQYHAFQELLIRLVVPNFRRKQWFADSGWEMAEALAHVVYESTKTALKQASFISVLANEVTMIDHESWLSVHAYITRKGKWSRESLLVVLVRLMEGNNA